MSNKHAKVNKTTAGKNFSAQNLAVTSENYGDAKGQNQLNVSVIPSKKKSADAKMTLDPSSLKISNGSASVSLAEAKDTERQKTGVIPAKNVSSKLKDVSGPSDVSHQKYNDHSAHLQSKSQPGKLLRNVDEPEPSVRQRGKNGNHELSTFNVSEGKYQTTVSIFLFFFFLIVLWENGHLALCKIKGDTANVGQIIKFLAIFFGNKCD